MIKNILTVLLTSVLFACFPVTPHDVDLEYYEGEWLFTGSIYPGSAPFDSVGILILNSDSSFTSTFSYFWDKDSSSNRELEGRWYPWLTATYHDNYYNILKLTVDGSTKSWRISQNKTSQTLTWYSDDYGYDEEFYWLTSN